MKAVSSRGVACEVQKIFTRAPAARDEWPLAVGYRRCDLENFILRRLKDIFVAPASVSGMRNIFVLVCSARDEI